MKKRDVETLLAGYDADPIAALASALRIVLVLPEATWAELVAAARFRESRATQLLAGDVAALDDLARELNELRGLSEAR